MVYWYNKGRGENPKSRIIYITPSQEHAADFTSQCISLLMTLAPAWKRKTSAVVHCTLIPVASKKERAIYVCIRVCLCVLWRTYIKSSESYLRTCYQSRPSNHSWLLLITVGLCCLLLLEFLLLKSYCQLEIRTAKKMETNVAKLSSSKIYKDVILKFLDNFHILIRNQEVTWSKSR